MNVLGHSGAKGHESQTKAGANLGTMLDTWTGHGS